MATNCRSCGEPIEFRRTAAGKLNPISLKTGESHFIDCPQRREWRKEELKQTSFMPDEPAAEPGRRDPFSNA
jgi:hypothetical protein